MQLRKLESPAYFKSEPGSASFYLDDAGVITRLWDGVVVTGLFMASDIVTKIEKPEAIELAKKFHNFTKS